jgi:hypothetical protein
MVKSCIQKNNRKIRLFVARQICVCASGPDCCAAPGQTEKEIENMALAIKESAQSDLEVNDIKDTRIIERFPAVIKLFKKYGYNSLPIIMVGEEVVSYGIPDSEFMINSLKKFKKG